MEFAPIKHEASGGLHIHSAWRMLGKRPKWNEDGKWTYLRSEDVLEAVGLKTIAHYVDILARLLQTSSLIDQSISYTKGQ